jgi:hypothetical protein
VLNFRAVKRSVYWLLLAVVSIASVGLIFRGSSVTTDFETLREGGRIALSSHPHLYTPHLPHELLIFAPLSLLSFSTGLWLWRLASVGMLLASTLMLCSMYKLSRTYVLAAMASFPVIYCLCMGQDSLLILFLLTGSLFLAHRGHMATAGLVLALALIKPQVPCVIALAMLCSGHRRYFYGFAFGAVELYLSIAAFFGPSWVANLLALTSAAEIVEAPTKMLSLHGLFSFLGNFWGFAPAITISVFLVISRVLDWRKNRDVDIVFGSAIIVGSLCAFHFHVQDASLFLIPLAALTSRGLTTVEKWSVAPFFAFPVMLFLMYVPATALLVASSIVWLRSFKRAMMPGINCLNEPAGGAIADAVPNE